MPPASRVWVAVALSAVLAGLAGCASPNGTPATPGTPGASPQPSGSVVAPPTAPDTLAADARLLAARDGVHRRGAYLPALTRLQRRCGRQSPAALLGFVTAGYSTVIAHHVAGASYLSVVRSVAAGTTPAGSLAACRAVLRAYVLEAAGKPSMTEGLALSTFGAPTEDFAKAHPGDPAHPGGYLPVLADGDDSFVVGAGVRVTRLTRNFDPPVSQTVALSSLRRQLVPPDGIHSVYTLTTLTCHEQVYLGAVLGLDLGSPANGVMVELTSGHGVTSRYDPALVDRALLSVGGRIGGQPCV